MQVSAEATSPAHPKKKLDPSLADMVKAQCESSGLTPAHAKALGMRGLSPEETKALGQNFHECRSLYLPYFDLDGKKTKFFRVRYLGKLPGWAGVVEKPQRYAQPKGTLNEVYFPPILPMSWREVADDPKLPIYVTEGEKKAACACANGLACIGLGGVDVWRSSKREVAFLPALAEIKWDEREVVIIYDSDAATNPNVVRAQRKLADALVAKGALPSIASLPPRKDGSKQGLDDLIVSEGVEALNDVLKDAPAYPEAAALWEMNEEVACVLSPGMIVVKKTGEKVNAKMFVGLTHANRHYVETQQDKNGNNVFKKKPLAPKWISWEHRHEVAGVTYAPGKPRIVDGKWNDWNGWGVEPEKGDIGPWEWLLDHIFKGQPKIRTWFEQWCAYPLQHPGTKLYAAPLIWGREHGTGKTAMAYALKRIYGSNAIEIKNKDLRKSFNAWQRHKQFVYGDEIEGNPDLGAKKLDAEWLKGLVTQDEVTINEKYLPEYTTPDVINYMFSGNKPDAAFLEDRDRRFMIHEVVVGKADQKLYDVYDAWLKGSGPSHLFHYLLNLKLDGFHPRAQALETFAKQRMILNGKSDVGGWVLTLREDPVRILAPLGERPAKECDLYDASQLLRAYDPDGKTKVGPIGLGKELQKGGLQQVNEGSPLRTVLGIRRLYAVRNVDEWTKASPKAVSDHFNRFFGNGKVD